jgi:DNA primase
MSVRLQDHELEEILKHDIGLDKVRKHVGRKGVNFMFCCPFHGESKPSAGILNSSDGAYGQCYSCEETFSLPKLYAHVKGIEMYDAMGEIAEKFNVEFKSNIIGKKKLKRYDEAMEIKETSNKRFELPRYKLAPFRSGKETHKYFFNRGFTKQTVKEAMIGWDKVRKRVTIPIFHRDGVLAGFTGRAVLEQKLPNGKANPKYIKIYGNEPKYYIYENFPIGEVLYGSHEFYSEDNTAIIVEGTLDRLWLRQLGFTNVLSIIVAKMSMDKRTGVSTQAQILHELGVEKVIFMHDNDKAGEVGKKVAYNILKKDFVCFNVDYPEDYKDPVGMDKEEIDEILASKTRYGRKELKRYE